MNQSETCYDSELFINEQIAGLTCPIELGILRNSVFDQFGHVFSKDAFLIGQRNKSYVRSIQQPLNENQIIKAIPVKNLIDELELKQFLLLKCNWKGTLDKYYSHEEKECPDKQLLCTKKDCNILIKRAFLKQHTENECLYQLIISFVNQGKIRLLTLETFA